MSFEISKRGTLVWKNEKGQWHREKGPALIFIDGYIEYRFNDMFHRLNGSARIWPDSRKEYWIYDTNYIKEAYYAILKDKL